MITTTEYSVSVTVYRRVAITIGILTKWIVPFSLFANGNTYKIHDKQKGVLWKKNYHYLLIHEYSNYCYHSILNKNVITGTVKILLE